MKKVLVLILVIVCPIISLSAKDIKIVATTDVHGSFFPYDFINDKPLSGSLARVMTYLRAEREKYGENLIYVDNGDMLQGQPTAYYYNTVDTLCPHLANRMLNYMGCRVATIGNHDVETGPKTYNRYIRDAQYTLLGANIIKSGTFNPFINPYKILNVDGKRIAFLGMITPAIPSWLPKNLWPDIEFADMVVTAKKWIAHLRQNEKPDLIIGVFHSGEKGGITTSAYSENCVEAVVREVEGFDAVIYGHDHRMKESVIANSKGRSIPVIDSANAANYVMTLTISDAENGGYNIKSELVSVRDLTPDADFMAKFADDMETVKQYVSKRIGTFTRTIDLKDAYFGSCAFIDLIHKVQLDITHADVSITAPLSFSAKIDSGDVYVRDMFKLYKYENLLYTMRLTGKEIKGLLEMSYDQWICTMKTPDDAFLLFETDAKSVGSSDKQGAGNGRAHFKNACYNFDSAAGILYEIDVTKEKGSRVNIKSLADGRPFDLNSTYRVAINSYRGNGGGELLTLGAGIDKDELLNRIESSTERDLRFYLMQYIEKEGTMTPASFDNWRFVPESMTKKAIARDYRLLFGNSK